MKWTSYTLMTIFLIFFCSCNVSRYLEDPSVMSQGPKGLYAKLNYRKSFFDHGTVIGEIISVEKDLIFIKNRRNNEINFYNKDQINRLEVRVAYLDDEPVKGVTNARVINSLISIPHGWFMIITIPVGQGVISAHAKRKYAIRYPQGVQWHQLHKFARFPTGIPKDIDFLKL